MAHDLTGEGRVYLWDAFNRAKRGQLSLGLVHWLATSRGTD